MSTRLRVRRPRGTARGVALLLGLGALGVSTSWGRPLASQPAESSSARSVLPAPEQVALAANVSPRLWFVDYCERESDVVSCTGLRSFLELDLGLRVGLSSAWSVAPVLALGIQAGSQTSVSSTELGSTETRRTSQVGQLGAEGRYHPFEAGLWLSPRATAVVVRDSFSTSGPGAQQLEAEYTFGAELLLGVGYDLALGQSAALVFGAHGGYVSLPEPPSIPPDLGTSMSSGAVAALSLGGVFAL